MGSQRDLLLFCDVQFHFGHTWLSMLRWIIFDSRCPFLIHLTCGDLFSAWFLEHSRKLVSWRLLWPDLYLLQMYWNSLFSGLPKLKFDLHCLPFWPGLSGCIGVKAVFSVLFTAVHSTVTRRAGLWNIYIFIWIRDNQKYPDLRESTSLTL